MKEKYLPIGTVVRLKNGTKKMMIIGFMASVKTEDNNTSSYDYIGCLYPEGFISVDNMLLFQHDQIEEVYNEPYADEESGAFHAKLTSVSQEISTIETLDSDKE